MNSRIAVILLSLLPMIAFGTQAPSTPSIPDYCDVAGNYEGTFSGDLTGKWNATVNPHTGSVSINMTWENNLAAGAGNISSPTEHKANVKFYEGTLEGVFKNFDSHHTASTFSGQWTNRQNSGDFRGERTSYPDKTCYLYPSKTQ